MAAKHRNLKPRSPGQAEDVEQEQIESEDALEDENVAEVEQDETVEASTSSDSITMSKSELAALVADMVDRQVEQRVVAEVKAARRQDLAKSSSQAVELPDQKDIDASQITRSVLTKQGWVCPLVHPSDRNRMKKLND
jgi:hypothetical protein